MTTLNKVCKTTITPTGVTLEFTNGKTLEASIKRLPEDTVIQSALFGIRRKVTNSFADAKGNVDKAYADAKETIEQLEAGQWTVPREVGPSTRATSDLVEAIMAITGKAREAVETKLDAMSKEDRAALRKNEQVNAALLEVRAVRARAKVGEAVDIGSMF